MAEPMAYALITGASSGIGRHLALELAARGLDVVLVARNDSPLQELRLEIETRHQVRATVIAIDLSVPGAAANLYTELRTSMPPPDVLVNNAGFGSFGLFHEADGEVLQRLVQVNILALTCLLRRALPEMRARGSGRVLNVASCAAFNAGPLMAVYFATKAYVLHLSEAVAQECVGSGVTVTAPPPPSFIAPRASPRTRGYSHRQLRHGRRQWRAMASGRCMRVAASPSPAWPISCRSSRYASFPGV